MIIWNAAHFDQMDCRKASLRRALDCVFEPDPSLPHSWRGLLDALERKSSPMQPSSAAQQPAESQVVRKFPADGDLAYLASDALLYGRVFHCDGRPWRVLRAYPLIERDASWMMVTLSPL